MKNKILILLIVSTLGTLSFSFVKGRAAKQKEINVSVSKQVISEPVGGFLSEDKL